MFYNLEYFIFVKYNLVIIMNPIVTTQMLCSGFLKEYTLCLAENSNNTSNIKCQEIKKIINMLECKN